MGEKRTNEHASGIINFAEFKKQKGLHLEDGIGERFDDRERDLHLVTPISYGEVKDIVDLLKGGDSVMLCLWRLDTEEAQRMMDFLCGTCYVLQMDLTKVCEDTYLLGLDGNPKAATYIQ